MRFYDEIYKYIPINDQEEKDKELILELIDTYNDKILSRENKSSHMSVSAWITNKGHDKILMNFHNIYKNWGWLGGHADGEDNPINIIIREIEEECGLKDIKLLSPDIQSLEILPVSYHIKNNSFVSSHLHLNITYIFEADENLPLRIKPDENSGLKWVLIDDTTKITNEDCMKPIYEKLNNRIKSIKA